MDKRKQYSILQEKRVAKITNGKQTVASGGTTFGGGDVLTSNWFFECKTVTTPKNSYSIKKQVIEKMKEQAFEQQKDYSALVFRFGPIEKDYYVVDEDTFKYLLQCLEYFENNEGGV